MTIVRLELRNFKGVGEGSLELYPCTVLVGGNNSGKSTVLEALFLAPNPIRKTPYGVTAAGVVSLLHKTLTSKGNIHLLHRYSAQRAEILCIASDRSQLKVEFASIDDAIAFSITETSKTGKTSKQPPARLSKYEDKHQTSASLSSYPGGTFDDKFTSAVTGETLYFHPRLIELAWEQLGQRWAEIIGRAVPHEVAKKISEVVGADYDDLTLEPFGGGRYAIYVREKGGGRIRLGDLGDGVQEVIMLLLLCELAKPKVLLIDDVESHLNPRMLIYLSQWLADFVEGGGQVVVSTHSREAAKLIAEVLDELGSRVVLLALQNGVLRSKELTLEDLEALEKAGVDLRVAEGILF